MKVDILIAFTSVTAVLAAPIDNPQDGGPLSLSFSSKALFETLGLGGLSVGALFYDVGS